MNSDLEKMKAAIAAAWDQSLTPPALRDACLGFVTNEPTKTRSNELRAYILLLVGEWLEAGRKDGHDCRVLEQVAWQTMHDALAIHCRAVKERDGEPFVPARVAIVAYHVADNVAHREPFACDLDGALRTMREAMQQGEVAA